MQNCFRKAEHKYQSDGNEMANDDDDFGQDWERLCRGQKYDFQSYVSVDRHVAISGVETVASPRLTKLYKNLKCFSKLQVEATQTVKTF